MLRLLGFLFLIMIILGGVGLWRGWFSLSQSTDDTGKKSITIGVDKDKFGEDVERVKDKIAKVTSGAVEKVDAANKTITVKTDAGAVEVPLDTSTTIKLGDQTIGLGDLKAGDRLKIDWHDADGKKFASSITVERD